MPITPVQGDWLYHGNACSRQQLPLQLAWAVTVHKSQGLTLTNAFVDIGYKGFSGVSGGLTFVAFSREKRLHDLNLQGFDYERLVKLDKMRKSKTVRRKTND